MKFSLFWDVTQRRRLVSYRRFGRIWLHDPWRFYVDWVKDGGIATQKVGKKKKKAFFHTIEILLLTDNFNTGPLDAKQQI